MGIMGSKSTWYDPFGFVDMGKNALFPPNPSDAAMRYIEKIPGQLHEIYDPYINRGNAQYEGLNKQYTAMGQDPTAFLNKMMEGYEPSKAYQLQKDEALRAAGNTAAAGGTRGTLQDITKATRLTDMLMGQDMQQWLGNVMGIQDRGLSGQQHFYDQGFDLSKTMGSDLANVLGTQGQLAFQGQANRNKSISDIIGALIGAGGMIAGGAMGGPAGAMAGGAAGRAMMS
jgi:hypothetical protein